MARYKVLVHGENFFVPIEGRCRKVGFYSTVFVTSSDCLQAGQTAVRSIQEDQAFFDSVRNDPDDPPQLRATDVEEIDADSEEAVERTGLSFYQE
jgi:hypothetical protein